MGRLVLLVWAGPHGAVAGRAAGLSITALRLGKDAVSWNWPSFPIDMRLWRCGARRQLPWQVAVRGVWLPVEAGLVSWDSSADTGVGPLRAEGDADEHATRILA
jgi:hypothetical protein